MGDDSGQHASGLSTDRFAAAFCLLAQRCRLAGSGRIRSNVEQPTSTHYSRSVRREADVQPTRTCRLRRLSHGIDCRRSSLDRPRTSEARLRVYTVQSSAVSSTVLSWIRHTNLCRSDGGTEREKNRKCSVGSSISNRTEMDFILCLWARSSSVFLSSPSSVSLFSS